MTLRIFWTPAGITIDSLRNNKRLVDISDGDTPNIRMNVRMLSIDTPEKRSTAGISLNKIDDMFGAVGDWIQSGDAPLSEDLAQHLVNRMRRDKAATTHLEQGEKATEAHNELVDQFLTRPNGRRRTLFVRAANQPFDRYGRLLAYIAPNYSKKEREEMSRRERATFNLRMVSSGWAAPFILYPNIPGEFDLPLMRDEAAKAISEEKGAWEDPLMLTGYEFRSMERLAKIRDKLLQGKAVDSKTLYSWIYRYCADMSTGELFAPQDYVKVKPQHRIFIWQEDVRQAIADLNLVPAGVLAK